MSPLAELRAGKPGEAFMVLLARTVLAVAITRNFPPPDGGPWNGAKANDVAVSFLTHERTPKRLDWLVLHAGDDAALAAALQGLVRNFLRDLGRATEMGRLVVRLRRALRESDRFVPVAGDRWTLAGGREDGAEVRPDALIAAAAVVPVTFQTWSPTARRHEPFADRDSIEALLIKVLDTAGGSLRPSDLAHAIAPSLQAVTGPLTVDLDAGDHPDGELGPSGSDALGDDVVNRVRAREVFEVLSDRERIALAHLHLNLRELAPLIGLGRSQAATVRNRAVDVLQAELADESAAVGFEPGTTFVVAPNGIGKTSLLEAAKFALTGSRVNLSSPVQLDADVATVELTLQLPSARVLVVRRQLFADPAKPPTFHAFLGNDELTEAGLAVELDAVFGASPEFIGRNAFLSDSLRDGGPLDLRSQLARAFGLDVKRADAARLTAVAAEREEEAKQLGREVKSEAKEIARTEADFHEAQDAAGVAEARLIVARAGLKEAEAKRQFFLQNNARAARLRGWEQSTATVVAAASAFVPGVTADRLVADVEDLLSTVEAETASLQTRFTTLQARLELIDSALGELIEAGADCPVCLRPLDDHDRAAAEVGHRAEAARLAAEMNTIDVAAAASRYQDVRALMRQVDGLGPRPEDPSPSDDTGERSQALFDQARIDLEDAAAVHNAAVARATQLAEALVEAYDAEARTAESVSAWRRWALTSAAASTLMDTVDEVLANEVEPLAVKVGERWNTLFADRPDLRFDLDGDLWREFRGHRLGIDAFSAGEQMAARLLMQLAILTSATRVTFCWIDEPLEHLDPKTRRLVAGMLSHGRDALGLRQLVVTTYEEELAQRLSEADETTAVQYVRAGTGP